MKDVIKMLAIFILALLYIWLLSGCAVVPHNQCDTVFRSTEEVRACKERAIRREDHRVKREQLKLDKKACAHWDNNWKRCITRDQADVVWH